MEFASCLATQDQEKLADLGIVVGADVLCDCSNHPAYFSGFGFCVVVAVEGSPASIGSTFLGGQGRPKIQMW